MLRRAFLVGAATLVLAGSALAQQGKVARVGGTVTAHNYRAFAAFLQDQFDNVVALSVTFPANDRYADGVLWAGKEGDLFVAYLPGPDNDSQISAATGFVEDGAGFVFDRFYKVGYGGMGQGIVAIYLEPTLPPPGMRVEDVSIDALN